MINPFIKDQQGAVSTSSQKRKDEIERAKDFGLQTRNVPPDLLRKRLEVMEGQLAKKDALDVAAKDLVKGAIDKAMEAKRGERAEAPRGQANAITPNEAKTEPKKIQPEPTINVRPVGGQEFSPCSNTGIFIPIYRNGDWECFEIPDTGDFMIVFRDGVITADTLPDCPT